MSTKRQIWLAEYLKCWNATEAARRAGYKHPNVYAATLKKDMADEIKAALEEHYLTAEEILYRNALIARFDPTLYIDKHGYVDIDKLQADGMGWIVKELELIETRDANGDIERRVKFKAKDGQRALQDGMKIHGLFAPEEINVTLTPEQAKQEVMDKLARLKGANESSE